MKEEFVAPLQKSENIQDRLDRHRAFWARRPVETPLVAEPLQDSIFPLENLELDLSEGKIVVEDVHPEIWKPPPPPAGPMQAGGDLFYAEWAFPALPWTEAIAGCPVRVMKDSGTTWADLVVDPDSPLASLHPRIRRDWLDRLLECTRTLVDAGQGRYWVSTTLMRGPLDMMEAMIGAQRLFLAFYDEPDEVHRLLNFCTNTWIEVAQAQLACIPPMYGGYCNRYKVWAPGTSVVTQADLSGLLSPALYEEFILPCDARIAEAFDYVTMHSHSTGQTQLELRLNLDNLDCIEVALDPVGPTLKEMLPTFERILARKSLILMGTDAEETAIAIEQLPAAGFCIIPRY